MSRYLKSITALVTGWIGWGAVVIASPSRPVTASEWLALAIVTATAAGVYAAPNKPEPPSLPPAFVYQPVAPTSNPSAATVTWSEPAAKPPPPVMPAKKAAAKAAAKKAKP